MTGNYRGTGMSEQLCNGDHYIGHRADDIIKEGLARAATRKADEEAVADSGVLTRHPINEHNGKGAQPQP